MEPEPEPLSPELLPMAPPATTPISFSKSGLSPFIHSGSDGTEEPEDVPGEEPGEVPGLTGGIIDGSVGAFGPGGAISGLPCDGNTLSATSPNGTNSVPGNASDVSR